MAEYATDGTDNRQMHWIESPEPMEIHMDRLGHEYEMLKTLLSDLHKYVTSNLEINDSPFERELKPDPPMANLYRQAQDIYHFLKTTKEIESEMVSSSKQLMELLSLISGDGEHHKTLETGRKGRTKDVSQSLLEQSDRQKKEFQHALSELEQIKQRQQHMERLGNENEILKTLLNDLHKYLTSHMEIIDSPFELSSAFRPDPPVANLYKQAQEVYHFLKEAKEMERHMERLGNENESLKTLLSDLHKYVTSHTEINESPFELSSAIEPDPPVANLFRQAQDVYQFLKETKERARHMDRLGNENEICKTLLSDLHKYVTSHMQINDSPFELSKALRPDPPVVHFYKQAQDVYQFLKEAKEMESETASVSKQLLELLSIIIGDGEHHKPYSTGRERGTTDVSHSLLQQSDSQKERFKRALYVLEQMKETQK